MSPKHSDQEHPLEQPAPDGNEASGDADPSDASALAPDELEQLRAQLQASREEAEHNLQGWQRAQADLANYRRRTEQERADQVKFAELRLIVDLLPVVDDLDRLWRFLPNDAANAAWVEGVRLIDQKLRAALSSHGLSPLEAEGKEFDPYQHEAVMREDGDPSELTIVVQELQRGYRLHDRVVRPSMVKVGRRRQEASATTDQANG